jgi:hypothetical protein
MHFRILRFGFMVLLLMGMCVFGSQVQAEEANQCVTIEQCTAEASAAAASAKNLYDGLQQALTSAQNAGDKSAVRFLTTALRRAEVRLEQAQSAAQRAKAAATVSAASAEAGQAKNTLGKIQGFIHDLTTTAAAPYIAPIIATTVPATTVPPGETKVPTTIHTTISTTTTSTTTTIIPTSP